MFETDNENEVIKEIELDPELQKMLLESELDEKAGRVYTTDEAIEFIKDSGNSIKNASKGVHV